jgi:hypothetical protein
VARPVQRDTQWESARYGTGFGLMIGAHQKRPPGHLASVGSPQLPGVPFGLLPRLIYPTTPLTTPPCQRALVGHFLFSAKFICMGKQKNRLTAIQTIYQHAQKNPSRARKFSISRHPPDRPPAPATNSVHAPTRAPPPARDGQRNALHAIVHSAPHSTRRRRTTLHHRAPHH